MAWAQSGAAPDVDGLTGKVFCGYQGWFRTPDDGTGLGWFHYGSRRRFEPGACSIDLWPDVRELAAEDRTATSFLHPDGSAAEVFSSARPGVAKVHFRWMKEHGINGVFLQRFAVTARDPRHLSSMDAVLDSCRAAAKETGREWALMYDLSGLKPGEAASVIDDWSHLQQGPRPGDPEANPTYLRHRGKPLVALWGLGFSDRAPMLDEWEKLITFFKTEAWPGGCAVMLGVPTFWRTLDRDAIADPALHRLIAMADVVSPWAVGRYNAPRAAASHIQRVVPADRTWCAEKKLDYLPVVFPGFSWRNLSAGRGQDAPLDAIPRLGGRFFWSQCLQQHRAGATALYVAMFDELDEATAIFKTRSDPPVGASSFVAEKDVPGDHYLWLTGQAGRLLRGELTPPEEEALPPRTP